MADVLITTYAELRTAIAQWLAKEGSSRFADQTSLFVQMAEAEINRRLRVADQELTTTLAFLAGDASKDLPSDFGGLRGLPCITGNALSPLEFLVPSAFDTRFRDPSLRDIPRVYTIKERKLFVKPIPDGDADISILYYQGVPVLRTTDPNWLLTAHPDIYFNGTMYKAHAYTSNEQKAALWKGLFEEAMEALEDADWHDRWSGSPVISQPSVVEGRANYPRFRFQGQG